MKGKERFIMGLWDKINAGITMPNCDNCENYQKKEMKMKYNDEFQIRYNKKDVLEIKFIHVDNWYEDDEKYCIAYTTETNVKTTNYFPKGKYDKFKVTQSR